jgi:hypothetical protein
LRLFDAYLFVDFSASSRPKTGAHSIWIADGWFSGGRLREVVRANPATRREGERWLRERIGLHQGKGRRALVGFDFPLGYPDGSPGASWRTLWRHLAAEVQDDERNRNNRFDLARRMNEAAGERWYWGCPKACASDQLAPTKIGRGSAPEYRLVERKLLAAGRRPFSVCQLLGSGSVGSQALLGLPICERLRADLGSVAVWPFETGLRSPERDGAAVVLCEIWPSLLEIPREGVRDEEQVLAYVRAAASRDAAGTLREWFEVSGLAGKDRALAASEGWVLGFNPPPTAPAGRRFRSPRTAPTSAAASAGRRSRPSAAAAR